jgi:phage gp16-like protein
MAIPARNLAPYKGSLIKIIHVAKTQLDMDDETYRTMLRRLTGRDSCSALGMSQLEAVVDHLRGLGFEETTARRAKVKANPKPADDPQSRKIRSLWLTLRDMGAITDSSEAALASFVKRQTRVERLEWLNTYQAERVIEGIKMWIKRLGG